MTTSEIDLMGIDFMGIDFMGIDPVRVDLVTPSGVCTYECMVYIGKFSPICGMLMRSKGRSKVTHGCLIGTPVQ